MPWRNSSVVSNMEEFENRLKSVSREHISEPICALSVICAPVVFYRGLPYQSHIEDGCQKAFQFGYRKSAMPNPLLYPGVSSYSNSGNEASSISKEKGKVNTVFWPVPDKALLGDDFQIVG